MGSPGSRPPPTVPVRILWAVNDRFLRALRREPVDRTPVWFMRQAGRYLPEYRELRGDRDILDAIREPEVAVELTLQPLRRMPLDAAIVFADIMVPVAAIGVPVRIDAGRRPGRGRPGPGRGRRRAAPCARARSGRAVRRRDDPPPAQGAQGPADRVRGRAVHARELPGRGRSVAGPRPDEGAPARRARYLVVADGCARGAVAGPPPRADRGGRAGGAGVRLVGGCAGAERLRAVGAPVVGASARGPRRCPRSTSAWGPASS